MVRWRRASAANACFAAVIGIAGRGESHVEQALLPCYARWKTWPLPIDATILAAMGQVELHLTVRTADDEEGQAIAGARGRGREETNRRRHLQQIAASRSNRGHLTPARPPLPGHPAPGRQGDRRGQRTTLAAICRREGDLRRRRRGADHRLYEIQRRGDDFRETMTSGISNLLILKTSRSGFENFAATATPP